MKKKFSATDLMEELSQNRIPKDSVREVPKKVLPRRISNKKVSPATRKYLKKFNSGRFNDFDHRDWLMYFQQQYKEANKIGYQVRGQQMYYKHFSILRSLVKNYTPNDIKSMIDFLFTSNQDLFDKGQLTVFHLSSGFLATVYQNTQLWIIGEYKTKSELYKDRVKKTQRTREWTGNKQNKIEI